MPSIPLDRTEVALLASIGRLVLGAVWAGVGPFGDETERPLRVRVSMARSRLLGPDVTARFTCDVAYGPTTAPLPDRTVASEDACP